MDSGSTVPRDERTAGRWMGVLILFILVQRQFLESIARSGLKG